ncbi:Multidrug resistance protein A [Neochlamydia sp. TUME1]|uniref:HlyD family efflux transporter periplasmic adaptor subunit n=1 Tax=Neochlamydia sp. TUME1 TaxID=1478174 RepID=UPI000583BD3C|nr:HlyD family efflux transporter periplasmic adaptor subunit [Neochlamydia sp. TUME1]KIC76032.1 Multidrug resistance protein A [Neochlamydia sp. TUME1]
MKANEETSRMIEDTIKDSVARPQKTNKSSEKSPNPDNLDSQEPSSSPLSPSNTIKRNRKLWGFTLILALASLSWGLLYVLYLQGYETTDDAYASGNMININPSITGSVIAYYVDDTDFVTEGQLLVQLDQTEYLLKYEHSLASLASTVLKVRQLYEKVKASQSTLEARKIALSKANYDYENRSHLVGMQAISKEEYTHSKADLSIAKATHQIAEAELAAAIAAVGNTSLECHPLLIEAKSQVRKSYYDLQHCRIYAPATGYVAQRTVNVGQSVRPQTPLMAIISQNDYWVEANFKETQLKFMRIGQPATINFDMYGSKIEYVGKVVGIASGSGSKFSLIPPQNATGNWIKIVQRLPVRISVEPEQMKKYPLRLGISAKVKVDISNQDLPMLASTSPGRPLAATTVFNVHLEPIDHVIDEVIQANLKKKDD